MLLMLLIYVPNSVPVFIYFYQSCNIKWKTHFSKDTLFAFHLMYATQIMTLYQDTLNNIVTVN